MSSKANSRPDLIDPDDYVSDSYSSDSQVDCDSDYIPGLDILNDTSESCLSDCSDDAPTPIYVSVSQNIDDNRSTLAEVTSSHDTLESSQLGEVTSASGTESSQLGEVTSTIGTVTVQNASNKNGRRWDKKHSCPFCTECFAKLPRHLEQIHSGEIEVASILALPKSRERKLKWAELRNRGNYGHNTQVIKTGSGRIIPYRRPSSSTANAADYIPCSGCLAFFMKGDLWKHVKSCPKQRRSSGEKARPHEHQQASNALLPVSDKASHLFKTHILQAMKHDRISLVVRQDPLIVTFGTKMFAKNGHHVQQHQYIKQKVRELGRFLLQTRQLDTSVQTLKDCIDPTRFSLAVKAVKTVSGYKEDAGKYTTPSLALKLGHSLKKAAQYVKSEALQSQDNEMKIQVEAFFELCQVEWSTEVSSQALTTLHDNAYNKPKRIPLANDIKCLNAYLTGKASELSATLERDPDAKTWRGLSEVTLTQITLFNRRRVG